MPCNHQDACDESKALCERLFRELRDKVPGLQCEEGNNYCALRTGRAFAYIGHSKRKSHLRIWFLGSADKALAFQVSEITHRNVTHGDWKKFGGSFAISDYRQLNKAVDLPQNLSVRLAS